MSMKNKNRIKFHLKRSAAGVALVGLAIATASIAQGLSAVSGNEERVSARPLAVKHIHISSRRSFDEVKAALESRIRHVDLPHYRSYLQNGDTTSARAYLEKTAAPTGLSIIYALNHGGALALEDGSKKAMSYGIGNILTAASMTKHHLAAGLYAPIRVVLYESANGTAAIEYDKPSSTFRTFGDAAIDSAATQLDATLLSLLKEASN